MILVWSILFVISLVWVIASLPYKEIFVVACFIAFILLVSKITDMIRNRIIAHSRLCGGCPYRSRYKKIL